MDEWYQVAAAVLLLTAVTVFTVIRENQRRRRAFLQRIREEWGHPTEKEYTAEELASLSRSCKSRETDRFVIDEITWNDLNLDQVYLHLDGTVSSCGEEYLYRALRIPEFDRRVLEERDRLMEYFDHHDREREQVQEALFYTGRISGLSLSEYIGALQSVPQKSLVRYALMGTFALLGIILLFFFPAAGVVAFATALAVNTVTHSREAQTIEVYLKSLMCVLRILKTAEALGKQKIPELESYLERLKKNACRMNGIRKKCVTLVNTKGTDGDLASMLNAYFNTFFMLDFLEFYSVVGDLKKSEQVLEELLSDIGILDFAISGASYRRYLPYYCKPDFRSGSSAKGCFLDVQNLYHPLLQNPVANSICAQGGILVTGSNASGKSTFLKNVALNAILCQSLYTSLSRSWHGVMCRVMTSMALRDDLVGGESYYMVEIKSLKRILDAAADKAPLLCIVDEVLRGTNTVERIAASSQILRSLRKPHILCFAATHDIELSYILGDLYTNYHFEEEITAHDVTFHYLLKEGRAVSRNAIALLELIGYDPHVVEEARISAAEFERTGSWKKLEPTAGAQRKRKK